MADGKLVVLENRIDSLETRIFGDTDKDAAYPKDAPQIVDNLTSLNKKLNTTLQGHDEVQAVLKNISELEQYLDASYVEQLTLSLEAKTEIILAEEDLIRQQAANLEKIKAMTDVLGSEHIKSVPEIQGKLQQLSKVHIEQQDEAGMLMDDTKNLFQKYNTAIDLLSKQLVRWDALITTLEVTGQEKEPTE